MENNYIVIDETQSQEKSATCQQNESVSNKTVAIELDGVSYDYKTYDEQGRAISQIGVHNVSFAILQGQFVSLVGHNGSGKSTLAKLFNGLLLPQKGKVKVFGMDTSDRKNIFEVRKNVGMVFQNPDNQMVASIVEEDVAFGPENLGVPQPEIVQRVNDALQTVGMAAYAKKPPHNLSGGQKQRIAIAGALAIKPQVLVLDESTAMLDPLGRKEVLSVARKLNASGMTVVLITHFMEEVLESDRVIVMSGGCVVKQGTPHEIFADGELLSSVGLKAPRTIELAQKLKSIGFDVNEECADPKKLGGDVCRNLQR